VFSSHYLIWVHIRSRIILHGQNLGNTMATPAEPRDDVPSWMRDDPESPQSLEQGNASTTDNNIMATPAKTALAFFTSPHNPLNRSVNTKQGNGDDATATSTPPRPMHDIPSWMQDDAESPPSLKQDNIATAIKTNNTNVGNSNTSTTNSTASSKTWNQYIHESFQRDGRLLIITLVILICMNIPYIQWILYPFTIFSTWIHELCHGMAAIFAGGSIQKILIFSDTSGLAYTVVPSQRKGFVISAGYQGTAAVGCLLLLFRRTKRGPRAGTMSVAITMILSCLLWIRNIFGFAVIFIMGIILAGSAIRLPSVHMRNVYVCLAVTCSLNAVTSVRALFGSDHMVNGEPSGTDAHSMAEVKGGTSSIMWAMLWLVLALVLTFLGIVFAVPGPDEVADFRCCGVCQDVGLFGCCNYPGQRFASRIKKKWSDGDNGNRDNDNERNNNINNSSECF